ncbi:MAG: polysaccharide biosynthesis tyrosine autokinase [Rubrivivax sp.]|nr:MAG: polysaccharide biosynthesis tyrosine autokinase [Rubrivivax sp.]
MTDYNGHDAATQQPGAVPDSVIGTILRDRHSLTAEQVAAVIEHQNKYRVKFGEAAVALGLIRSEDVIWALSQQFHYPYQPQPNGSGTEALPELLVTANAPFSEQAEFFRDIRSQLLMAVFSNTDVPRSLAVTSAASGEGKTYFAANMAVAFSQLGARTLLIDADMRNPAMHDIFGIDSTAGLSSILADRSETNVVRPVPSLPSLFLVPVGVKPPNPTELIQRPSFSLLLNELYGKFDYIIVDTPAVEFGSDALMVAARCGVTVTLARRNQTKRAALETLVGRITKCPTRFAGVIVNDF